MIKIITEKIRQIERRRTSDISEIESADISIDEPLEVRIKKIDAFVHLALIIIAQLFFIYISITLKKYFIAVGVLLVPIPTLIEKIKLFRIAMPSAPYFTIEEDGIFFKKMYYWEAIGSIQIHKYFYYRSWNEEIYVNLKNGERITIDLPNSLLTEDTDVIAAFIKKYMNAAKKE